MKFCGNNFNYFYNLKKKEGVFIDRILIKRKKNVSCYYYREEKFVCLKRLHPETTYPIEVKPLFICCEWFHE